MRAAHSRALKGTLARQPTGASHGLSRTLADVASCVLVSLKSAPRSQARETRLLASAQSHGPEPPPRSTKNERGLRLTVSVLTGRPIWLGLLREANAGASASRLAARQGSVRPPQTADVRAQNTEGLCPRDTKQSLGAGRRPLASLPPPPVSGVSGDAAVGGGD